MEPTFKPDPDSPGRPFPIVGIGASAGGLDSLERFLSALPGEFGFALVFMQHLSPTHKSLLPELLSSRKSALSIEDVSDGLEILPGKLYLCPPAHEVRIERGIFRVASQTREHLRLPIDEFFISLAEDAAERAIAVIFSGAGTDGARGVHAVRTAGGTVFVQDPATAEFSAMPLAALGTGQVDAVLPPEEIAGEILKFHTSGMVALSPDSLDTPQHLERFYRLIHEKTGYRFNHYKKSVVSRRIKRRMYLHGLSSVNAYLEMISANDAEVRLLASDLMIGVTSFFRDRLAWQALHLEATRKLVVEDEASPIRVWTPACATGEEAYSIAMLLQHEFDLAGRKREIQVFATDVNDQALDRAREGTYPATIAADLPADYLEKFFTASEDGFSLTINKEIRQLVVFAKQDILTDPPFSRLDLVICRNLLIYLEPDAQERCIALFHYALKEGGYLFLGGAESPGRHNALFASLAHKKCRIYRKIETKASARMPLAVPFASEHLAPQVKQASSPRHPQSVVELSQEVLLEEYAPAAVTINQNYDILYNNGPTSRYLRQPRGPLTSSLLDLLPENVRNRIRGAVYRAGHDSKVVSVRADIPDDSGRMRQVTIRISNLRESLYLVIFREKGSLSKEPEEISPELADMEEAAVRQLEQELSTTREDLQGHIEQLKSLNEELHSSNEELQAANEELETSREELQSLNEELTTVNAQLQTKIEDEEETNNDLNNFLASTNIPTIFLDIRFRVKRFTPAMSRLIKLLPGDVGRPIIDMSQAHLGGDLVEDAQSVLEHLTPVIREIGINGSWYVRNILPYRTSDNRIEGVIITYTDITQRKRQEEELRKSRDEMESRVCERTEELQKAYEKLKEEIAERERTELQLCQAQKVEALGTLSGGVAHDFNNILAAIIGFTELTADQVPQGSPEAHHLERVMEASLRGRELVRQMLTFSRKTEQEKKPLRLSSVVKETVRLIRATTPTTINIRVNASSESDLIFGDPTQIQQVLMNLSTNATYAMREKGGSLGIDLDGFSASPSNGDPHGIKPGRYVRLTVRDTGAGMSPDIMDKIFDPFFTTKELGEGSGLGLSVVHGIVRQHDGYITAESEQGFGSTFTVYFPKIADAIETDEVSDDEAPTGTERILFVDDEEALVEMGEDILAELGYEVTSRMNGREALALITLDPSRFDLVITDQTMPEMTGVELTKEILALRPDMPVIMCTGYSYMVNADTAKAVGIKAFAMKPLTKREIARTIRDVLDA